MYRVVTELHKNTAARSAIVSHTPLSHAKQSVGAIYTAGTPTAQGTINIKSLTIVNTVLQFTSLLDAKRAIYAHLSTTGQSLHTSIIPLRGTWEVMGFPAAKSSACIDIYIHQ